ncbi:hypothetical protein [Marinirhabdus gelatinilytica]|uniref:Uncharacterized protein n=1 Tax=Marinirhabdus gelatinilytica TaxID=1703343 RepID=A0A370QFI6_9FLAO|nr:hypothetical protein [Marinirhabdus gelatinilytica]RDK87128.1 hypothetical protein C8D94_102310 [Marinirhabdus gelatinilytica]
MDVLDTLKKDWQKQEDTLPKLTYKEIYSMLLKKSSSIVKWIFIISIAELLLWIFISFLVPDSSKEFNEQMGLKNVFWAITILNYAVFAVFMYLFYKNYKNISVTSNVKELMKNILKTRKTVRWFVYYNIAGTALTLLGANLYFYFNQDKLQRLLADAHYGYNNISPEQATTVFFTAQLIVGVVFIGLLMLFYYLIYGLLLKRLKRNYRELKKIEV